MKEREPQKEVKTSDYVLDFLVEQGVEHVFGFTGGGIATQLDAFSRNDKIKFIPVQHEQAAAMAAEAYGRLHKSHLGVAMATSGPGGTNLITGMCGAYFDSVPTLFITGQVGTFDLNEGRTRQIGFQEADMVKIMSPFTKYSCMVRRPEDIGLVLGQAVEIARSGRPGPVHVDIPIDVQMGQAVIESFKPAVIIKDRESIRYMAKQAMGLMEKAKRPVIVAGEGIRMAGAIEQFRELSKELNWPVLPSWAFADFTDKNRLGLIGVYGDRGANMAIQNADLILSIGSRLDSRMTGSHPKLFSPEAVKIVVDIDQDELLKGRFDIDMPLVVDAGDFIRSLRSEMTDFRSPDIREWTSKCQEWKGLDKRDLSSDRVNPYLFGQILGEETEGVVIPDCGGNLIQFMQSFKFKGQRVFSSFGNSSMGYALPASIGASFAQNEQVVCTIGDGGIQISIQELQTIVNNDLPIKIFVYNNRGYMTIRQFQDTNMGGRHVGSEEKCPDMVKVATAYGIPSMRIEKNDDLRSGIRTALDAPGPMIVDVIMDDTGHWPKVGFGKPLDQMSPPLT